MDLTIGDGKIALADRDGKGEASISADTAGQGKVRLDGRYLVEALKACGGMVDFKLTNAYSPTFFTADGYQLVVMPMMTNETSEAMKRENEAKQAEQAQAEATTTEQAEPVTEPVAEAEAVADEATEAKPKRSRKRDKVAVA
jgi:hypothetical protein